MSPEQLDKRDHVAPHATTVLHLAAVGALIAVVVRAPAAVAEAAAQEWFVAGARGLAAAHVAAAVGPAVLVAVLSALAVVGLGAAGAAAWRRATGEPASRRAAAALVLLGAGVYVVVARAAADAMAAVPAGQRWALEVALLGAIAAALVGWLPWSRWRRWAAHGAVRALGGMGVLVLLSATALWLAVPIWRAVAASDRAPVVLIVTDTLRADHLGFGGHDRATSPALDRLAAEGLVFTQAYSHAPWTSPSVAALMTSRHPHELGYTESDRPPRLPERRWLMGEVFAANGYRTQGIVSHTFVGAPLGFAQGFEDYDADNAQGHSYISSPSLTAKALGYLERRSGDPFFLFLHYFDPHFAYLHHPPYTYDPDYEGPISSGMRYADILAWAPSMSAADIAHVRALYDSEIRFTDEHLGLVLDHMRQTGLYDDAWVIFTADHGEAFLDRDDDWIGHGRTLYNELIHVPLVVKPPAAAGVAPATITKPVGLMDVLPSLVYALDLQLPAGHELHGRILPWTEPAAWPQVAPGPVFAETMARGTWLQSVVEGPWKLRVDHRSDTRTLYHLGRDPGEVTDVAAVRPAVVERLDALREQAFAGFAAGRDAQHQQPDLSPKQLEQLRGLGYLQ